MAVLGVVEANELVEVVAPQGVFLQGEMGVAPQVVDPELSCPGVLTAGFLIEEEDVGLHPGRVPDAGGEPEEGVDIGLFQESSPDCLAGAALEEHVVGDDDGAPAAHVEQGEDVLDEVELLVLGSCPEVLTGVGYVFLLQGAFFGDEGDAALLAEWWIGEDHAEAPAGIGGEGVHSACDGRGFSAMPCR